jgi:hypothetical protein
MRFKPFKRNLVSLLALGSSILAPITPAKEIYNETQEVELIGEDFSNVAGPTEKYYRSMNIQAHIEKGKVTLRYRVSGDTPENLSNPLSILSLTDINKYMTRIFFLHAPGLEIGNSIQTVYSRSAGKVRPITLGKTTPGGEIELKFLEESAEKALKKIKVPPKIIGFLKDYFEEGARNNWQDTGVSINESWSLTPIPLYGTGTLWDTKSEKIKTEIGREIQIPLRSHQNLEAVLLGGIHMQKQIGPGNNRSKVCFFEIPLEHPAHYSEEGFENIKEPFSFWNRIEERIKDLKKKYSDSGVEKQIRKRLKDARKIIADIKEFANKKRDSFRINPEAYLLFPEEEIEGYSLVKDRAKLILWAMTGNPSDCPRPLLKLFPGAIEARSAVYESKTGKHQTIIHLKTRDQDQLKRSFRANDITGQLGVFAAAYFKPGEVIVITGDKPSSQREKILIREDFKRIEEWFEPKNLLLKGMEYK